MAVTGCPEQRCPVTQVVSGIYIGPFVQECFSLLRNGRVSTRSVEGCLLSYIWRRLPLCWRAATLLFPIHRRLLQHARRSAPRRSWHRDPRVERAAVPRILGGHVPPRQSEASHRRCPWR